MKHVDQKRLRKLDEQEPNSFDLNIIIELSKNYLPKDIVDNLSKNQKEIVVLGVECMKDFNNLVNENSYLVYRKIIDRRRKCNNYRLR